MYDDNPNKYQTDNTTVAQAMFRAQEAQAEADKAKQHATAAEASERAKKEEIDRAVELSMSKFNQQIAAQRLGVQTNAAVRSQDVGALVTKEAIESTKVRIPSLSNYEVSYSQAKDMAELGQISKAEFNAAVAEGLAQRGFRAPPSF
ncbi:hypothetical protein FJ973_24810 [Mesorhizobium sp. B2-1-3]|uniref:hypothetical protein n=1 Tax=Mesorhizobium sp. B2-1-3 TaxID=2589972 RepID=UPI00112E99BC|nr:hypothetical protein [Mesorhizobium sp. B2-1-3]TPN06428.1 hypothetical protein FJ973_24810 [Mesorhizobium sp. B2-1-3]